MRGGVRSWIVVALLSTSGIVATSLFVASPSLGVTPHSPIAIVGDAGFTAANGVTGGSGTLADPYVLEGWDVDASSAHGILIQDTRAAFVIRNVNVHSGGFFAGVLLLNTTDGRVENITSTGNEDGIAVDTSARISAKGNNLAGCGYGISVYNSADLLFANNTATSSAIGADIAGASGVVVQDNVFLNTTYQILFRENWNGPASNYTIVRNRFIGVTAHPTYIAAVDRLLLEGNEFAGTQLEISRERGLTVRNNTIRGSWGTALHISDSNGADISDNSISDVTNGFGLLVESSNNLTVSGNTLTNVPNGLGLIASTNATVGANHLIGGGFVVEGYSLPQYSTHVFGPDNTVNGLPFAAYRNCSDLVLDGAPVAQVFVVECRRVQIRHLNIANLGMGIKLSSVEDAVIEGNQFANMTWSDPVEVFGGTNVSFRANELRDNTGVRISYAQNITVSENTFENGSGLFLWTTFDSRVYRNNFIFGGGGGSQTTNASWDDGYPTGGNYWYDYRGVDANRDGFGDTPYTLWPEGVDRYPRILPLGRPAIPPVARISTDNPAPFAEQTTILSGEFSTDADGTVLFFSWDFGDGTTGSGQGNFHRYSSPGNYTVALTVTDNSGLTNTTEMIFSVRRPSERPTAYFDVGAPQPLYPGVSVYFSADGSSTRYGTIASYGWDFGDGMAGTGLQTSHVFQASGTYHVTLTVTNSWGVAGNSTRDLTVEAIPVISLVPYSHPSGFRLPVPDSWSLSENERIGSSTVELVLRGPVHDSFQTNIIVTTVHDSSLREDHASMGVLVNSLIDRLRSNDPSLSVSEGTMYRTVSNHAAAEFAVQHGSSSVEQKVVIVVSEAHQEAWLVLLSVRIAYFPLYNATFERMVDGFVITAAPPFPAWIIGVGIALAAIGSIVLVVYLLRRRAARRPAFVTSVPSGFSLYGPEPGLRPASCGHCGLPVGERDHFCSNCGVPLFRSPPTPKHPGQSQ